MSDWKCFKCILISNTNVASVCGQFVSGVLLPGWFVIRIVLLCLLFVFPVACCCMHHMLSIRARVCHVFAAPIQWFLNWVQCSCKGSVMSDWICGRQRTFVMPRFEPTPAATLVCRQPLTLKLQIKPTNTNRYTETRVWSNKELQTEVSVDLNLLVVYLERLFKHEQCDGKPKLCQASGITRPFENKRTDS